MAQLLFTRREDGIIAIRRRRRWPRVCAVISAGMLVLIPLALSLLVMLPPVASAIPPLTLGLLVCVLIPHRAQGRQAAPSGARSRQIVPLHRAARGTSRGSSTSPQR